MHKFLQNILVAIVGSSNYFRLQLGVVNGWLVLIMFLVGLSIVAYAYWQSGLNKTWEAQSGGAPVADPSPARG